MENNFIYKKTKRKSLILFLFLFTGTLPAFLFLYMGLYSLNIFKNAGLYKIGLFYMKKIECGDGHGTDDFNCYGYGTINENKEKVMVNLGKTPGVSSFSKENYADLSSDTIMVFYRPDFKQTILKKENEQKLDKNRYLRKGLMELIYPILVYPLIVFYFRKTNRKLKQLENE